MPEVHRLDLMAEQSVIGAILLTDRCLTDVERELRPTDFRLEGDRALYEAALALERNGEKVDSVTILDRAQKMGAQVSRQYVLNLMELTPTAANVMEYVKLVKEESLRAALMETADRIREGIVGRESPSAVLSAAGQRLDDLASQSSLGRLVTPADGFLAFSASGTLWRPGTPGAMSAPAIWPWTSCWEAGCSTPDSISWPQGPAWGKRPWLLTLPTGWPKLIRYYLSPWKWTQNN